MSAKRKAVVVDGTVYIAAAGPEDGDPIAFLDISDLPRAD
ncbi:hypothetical protein QE359_002983 [Curtobacterium sp. SORGH_AS776]|nr:hypothetical protein [Curtobacterium sp. SORGH_AS_0776]